MDANDKTSQLPDPIPGSTAAPRPEAASDTAPSLQTPAAQPETPLRERALDLTALLILLSLSVLVFSIAGPTAFTTVTSVGIGLFATWRSAHHPRK